MQYDEALERLKACGQEHVLGFWDRLSPGEREALLAQVDALDLDGLEQMRELLARGVAADAPRVLEPADVVEIEGEARRAARADGEAVLRQGRVGVILVAGGQGSRLGFDGPKGCYAIGPVSGATLFDIHAAKLAAMETRYKAPIPFYIMTSETNDRATREFFEAHAFFGLDASRVKFFRQGMWPALWPDGRMVMDRPGHLFMGPDGHGGVLRALASTGMLKDMTERGVDTLFYFQVDNPLVEIADPAFIGLHCRRRMQMSLKVCAKRDPSEGLGVVVRSGGRQAVVEYTELTGEQKEARRPDGELLFKYGSVAIHVFDRAFLETQAVSRMPLHLAHKKVPYCGADGETVKPDQPNAYKFEKFIFDVLPRAERSLCLAFDRRDEFSPVKNAAGADSPDAVRRDMMRKFARWFEACGVEVPLNAEADPVFRLEIDPRFALDAGELRDTLPAGFRIEGDVRLAPATHDGGSPDPDG